MIEFNNLCKETPYRIFKEKYDAALNADQKNIEAISISSYNKNLNEVDSRFVNLKIVDDDNFIFFSNYNSPKSLAFQSHCQIGAIIFWSSTNTQIRIKANIKKTSSDYNKEYFKNRSTKKNALAISSNQSNTISSYEKVIKIYKEALDNNDLSQCPDYWGGFTFKPYYFEFWEGHESRINKRDAFVKSDGHWSQFVLEP